MHQTSAELEVLRRRIIRGMPTQHFHINTVGAWPHQRRTRVPRALDSCLYQCRSKFFVIRSAG